MAGYKDQHKAKTCCCPLVAGCSVCTNVISICYPNDLCTSVNFTALVYFNYFHMMKEMSSLTSESCMRLELWIFMQEHNLGCANSGWANMIWLHLCIMAWCEAMSSIITDLSGPTQHIQLFPCVNFFGLYTTSTSAGIFLPSIVVMFKAYWHAIYMP